MTSGNPHSRASVIKRDLNPTGTMHIIGRNDAPAAPATPEEAAAKRVADRELAAHRIHQYLIARIVNPKAARAMPDMVDLQILLDERKQLYELLASGQAQQVRTLALVLHSLGVDSVTIHDSSVEFLDGCSIRQNVDEEANTMTLELVRQVKDETP